MTDTHSDSSQATVLVVEDEPDMAELLAIWVGERYEVAIAHDGVEALEAMSDEIDVVLLDRRMPRMNGDEFLHEVKDRGYDARVVMVTAVDPGPEVAKLPFDDYVTKPVTKDVVLGVVERMLRLKQAGKAVREYHSLERRRDVLRTARATTGESDPETFEWLTRRLEAAAKDAGAGLAWLRTDYYEVGR